MISPKIFKNHVQMGMLKFAGGRVQSLTIGNLSAKDVEGDKAGGGLAMIGKGGLGSWGDHFCIIICSKAFSVYGEEVDDQMIGETELPHWMDLDTLYEFRFENDKDESEASKKTSGRAMIVIESVNDQDLKGKYNLMIETREKYTFYGMEYCKELNRWMAALRKAKMTSEELARTKANSITRNIDPFLAMYKKKVLLFNIAIQPDSCQI